MSHIPQRAEKDCLNCGTIVAGRYCQNCGQENVVPKETFWHMFTHFFYDITHFDSSFFHTVHHLIFKPGFLSSEYMAGKRAHYLHPIRMYVFTSAVFFLLFFSIAKPGDINLDSTEPLTSMERNRELGQVLKDLKKDSTDEKLKAKKALLLDTTKDVTQNDLAAIDRKEFHVSLSGVKYRSLHAYDSVQRSLPAAKRDGWMTRRVERKTLEIMEKVRENPNEAWKKFMESLLHRIPYMLFVSLPLFALILKLVYFRRKQFYYADHGVFTIHLYVFTFLLLMLLFGIAKVGELINWDIGPVIIGLMVLLYFYLYKAMRRFYGQRRAKTFLKFLLVSLLSLVLMIILLVIFIFFSAFTF